MDKEAVRLRRESMKAKINEAKMLKQKNKPKRNI